VNAPILPVSIQLVSLAVLLAFLGWVLWLIRSQRLHLRESLIWLVTTVAAIAVTAYPQLLVLGARLLGIQVPSNALFGAGLLYLAVNVLSMTITVSGDSARVRRLTQECALLRAQLEEVRRSAEERPQDPPGERHR
jgi:hypothetical protein